VLAAPDATERDWSRHRATTEPGPLRAPSHQGLHVHFTLVVTDDGAPLGLIDQHVWARDPAHTGRRHTRRQRATADNERQRWMDARPADSQRRPEGLTVMMVADREADSFDRFASASQPGVAMAIRARHCHSVGHEAPYWWDAAPTTRQLISEAHAPCGSTPLRWLLLTTLMVRRYGAWCAATAPAG